MELPKFIYEINPEKSSFWNRKNVVTLAVLAVLLISIPIGLVVNQRRQTLESQANAADNCSVLNGQDCTDQSYDERPCSYEGDRCSVVKCVENSDNNTDPETCEKDGNDECVKRYHWEVQTFNIYSCAVPPPPPAPDDRINICEGTQEPVSVEHVASVLNISQDQVRSQIHRYECSVCPETAAKSGACQSSTTNPPAGSNCGTSCNLNTHTCTNNQCVPKSVGSGPVTDRTVPAGAQNGICRDEPGVSGPAGYKWVALCSQTCQTNDQCPKNTSEGGNVNPDNSAWCFPFSGGNKCLQLQSQERILGRIFKDNVAITGVNVFAGDHSAHWLSNDGGPFYEIYSDLGRLQNDQNRSRITVTATPPAGYQCRWEFSHPEETTAGASGIGCSATVTLIHGRDLFRNHLSFYMAQNISANPPAAPTNITNTCQNNQATITWSAPAGVKFNVRMNGAGNKDARNNCPGDPNHTLCINNYATNSVTVTNTAGQNYDFWMTAVDSSGRESTIERKSFTCGGGDSSDKTAPTTTLTITDMSNNPLTTLQNGQQVKLKLTATDNSGGSGVSVIHTALRSNVSSKKEAKGDEDNNDENDLQAWKDTYQGFSGSTGERTATVPFYLEYLAADKAKNLETTKSHLGIAGATAGACVAGDINGDACVNTFDYAEWLDEFIGVKDNKGSEKYRACNKVESLSIFDYSKWLIEFIARRNPCQP